MRLKKLEIYGFKSFADRTEITFEQGITGIVGPNGCGKSNISDAVRWVLGEQSAKTLRGAKMEDVIFGGTEKRRRLSYCEVALVFDNQDRALPLDFGEVAVSRRVYRSGESEYAINRTPCRLRDVVDLFRDTGIGKEGYSLIGQGRIDELLSAKSEDRRQIFEEAAGIVKYKVRKAEAQKRMENTRDNLSRVEDIIAELEGRIEPLRQQSEAAREYLQLREELKGLELNAFLLRTERYNQRIGDIHQTLEGLRQAQEEAAGRQLRLTGQRDGAQEALADLETQAAAARETVQRLIREVEAREGAAGVLRERIAAAQRDQERLAGQLAAARKGGGGIQRQLDSLAEQIQAGLARQLALRQAQEKAEAELARSQDILAGKEEEAEQLKAQVIDAMNRLSDVRSQQARLGALREQLAARLEGLIQDRQDDGGQLAAFEEQASLAQRRLEEERGEKTRLDQLAAQAVEKVKALGQRGEALRQRVGQLTASQQEVSSRLKVLREMQRDYEGYQFSVKNVLMQAKRQANSGVHGVVATLIKVPRNLERAIDVALGPALQNVVVDREEDAKRMIEYLKENRLGRATFLPLSSVKGRTLDAQERRLLSMPGCLGLASELIQYQPQYQGVAQNLLGRTVVARDLNAGIQIMRAGRHAFRLVTLEGDVMNPGGSMTGGSLQSRMTSLLSREREVGEHQEKLAQIERELEEAQGEMVQLEGERVALKQERAELFDRLHQQDIACARAEAHLTAAQGELSAHASQVERIQEAVEQLTAQLAEVEQSLQATQGQEEGEDEQRTQRQARILDLSREIALLRGQVVQMQKEAGDGRVALTACDRDLEALTGDRERLSRQKSDTAQLLLDSEQALAQRQEQLGQFGSQLAEDEKNLARFKDELNRARGAFQAVEDKRMAAQQTLREAGQQLDLVRDQMDELADKAHRGEIQLSRLEGEFKQMTDRIWEDYELSYEGAQPFRDPGFRLTDSEKRIAQIRSRIKAMGSVNVAAVDEYRETMTRYNQLGSQRDDLLKAQLDLQNIVDDLTRQMEKQFTAQFQLLNGYFQKTFVKLFGGGHAELRLADPKDALNCGIDIVAQPPGKKLQMLSLLSGGERALTAIAILFAMLTLKPTPFCFLDEIEAALDDANIDNFAQYLHDFSQETQFVVVTHRKGTMERCDGLYGVAMEEKGVSRLVSVRLSEAQANAAD